MYEDDFVKIDVEFMRIDGAGLSGVRHEIFEGIMQSSLTKYGDDGEQIAWTMLAERFYENNETVKEKFFLISVNIETE